MKNSVIRYLSRLSVFLVFLGVVFFVLPQSVEAALTDGLQGYWKLEEASGTRVDSFSTNNLTDHNVGQNIGKLNNAAEFTTTTQWLSITDNTALSTGDVDFTIAGWVYLSDSTATRAIVSKDVSIGTAATMEYWFGYLGASTFALYLSNGTTLGSVTSSAFGAPSLNTWYYVVAWHDSVANTINIQVNNGTVNSTSWSAGALDTNSTFHIGSDGDGVSRIWNGRIDEVGFWKTVLTSDQRTQLYNSGNGLEFDLNPPDSITINTPSAYQVSQRDGNNVADITISGTYSGSPTSVEASWNGGLWETIDDSPLGGTFSGTLSNQSAGQGTLEVRFTNDTAVSNSKSYVGIGDIFVIAGQSNNSGRGTNNQTYSHATLKASLFGNDDTWKELSDPTDSNTSQVDAVSSDAIAAGSIWPLVTTNYLADQSVPIAFIPTAKGGSAISAWQRNDSSPGDTTTLYGSMYRRITAVGGVKAILFWQGETDAANGVAQATYKTNLDAFADDTFADFGAKTIVAQIGDYSLATATNTDNIRLAQADAWDDGGNVLPGPSLYDVNISDSVHFVSDSELQLAANRWWAAIEKNYYSGADGRGPQISAAEYNAAKTQIRLTFTDGTLPLLPTSGLSGFTVKDDGVTSSISNTARIANNQLRITLTAAASGTLTVSLGEGHTGKGATVPTDSSTYNLPAEIFVNQATTALDETAPTITNVNSDKTNGTYNVGEVVDIDVTFSEAVTSTRNVTVTLETGDTDRTCTFTVNNSTTGSCDYTVQAGDTSADLTISSISGTMEDGEGNTMTSFVPATNLGTNKDIVIDTTAPASLNIISPNGSTRDTKPTLSVRKSSDTNGISSYTVTLDSGKNKSYSVTGIPANGSGTASNIWRDDNDVRVEFANENDSDSANDEIRVYFKGLDSNELTEGKHTWTVTAYDSANNSTSQSTDFYLDRTSPSISELAIADVSIVNSGVTYNLNITNRTPSFSGLATDIYQGSTVTNSNGTKDTFDKVSSGPKNITLNIKKLKDGQSSTSQDAVYEDYLSKEFSLSDITNITDDKKFTRFFVTTPFPLVDGYYKVQITLKDEAGNTKDHSLFYISLNRQVTTLTSTIKNLFSGNLETELTNQETTPTETEEEKTQITEQGYVVKVKVVDDQNNPVKGAKVTIHSKVQETTSDESGIATFNNVEPGDHRILIAYDGYEGEQKVTLTGDVKEFSFNITVRQQNPLLTHQALIAGGGLLFVIIILVLLLLKAKSRKA